MFCTKCGTMIDDNSSFCTKCGAPQQAVAVVPGGVVAPAAAAIQQEREWVINQMNSSFEIMTAIKQKEDEIERLEAQMPELSKKANPTLAIIIGALTIPVYLIGVVVLIVALVQKNKYTKMMHEQEQNIQARKAELETLKNDQSLAWLPYDYRDSTYFAMMYGYIRNMRANSLQQAINLLETELHQARVELASQLTALSAADAASSAGAAAAGAAASAFFSLFK